MAESDAERIKALLQTVRTESQAVEELLRRTAGEQLWEILHPDELKEVEVFPDRADELRDKWRTEAGQLWRAGPHQIICGDCTDESEVVRLWREERPRARLI
jgi:Arc/MetJ family transcription regulator